MVSRQGQAGVYRANPLCLSEEAKRAMIVHLAPFTSIIDETMNVETEVISAIRPQKPYVCLPSTIR
jgi:hypothetical protein